MFLLKQLEYVQGGSGFLELKRMRTGERIWASGTLHRSFAPGKGPPAWTRRGGWLNSTSACLPDSISVRSAQVLWFVAVLQLVPLHAKLY